MPARQTYESYTVVKGDTVSKIASRYGTSAGAIAAASGLKDANKITVGQVLSVPVTSTYDPDDLDLSEVRVNAKRITPASGGPFADAIAAGMSYVKQLPPWVLLGVAAAASYYLLAGKSRRR